jgi:hypothetical protein
MPSIKSHRQNREGKMGSIIGPCLSGLGALLAAMLAGAAPAGAAAPATTPTAAPAAPDAALLEPRRIAAAIVSADMPVPKTIVQIGAHHGEFLSVFLDRFPAARGLWTEPNNSENNMPPAKAALARFGDRVDFHYGCAARDIRDGCVPKGTDVIITDWMSILQNLDGIYKIYAVAAQQLSPGGWLVVIDKIGFGDTDWDPLLQTVSKGYRPEHEAPPVHHADYRTPTAEEQLGAMRAAGLDARVVWRSFNTVLIMGRKN